MKINENTTIKGEKVILVPYRREHVERYHGWMQSPFLREMTASEPLSLKEEYEMQEKWRVDEDKCTFIILDRSKVEDGLDECHAMIGDTNLFLLDDDDDDESLTGEIEIMIAEEEARGKGFALESLHLMIDYCHRQLKVSRFVAKIGMENAASIGLFTRKLGFIEISRSSVFKEITFELRPK